MKIAGIIAEYNPFHNGHAYHIEETRKQTGCDYIIAVISGDFVQQALRLPTNTSVPVRLCWEARIWCWNCRSAQLSPARKPLPGQGFVSLTV